MSAQSFQSAASRQGADFELLTISALQFHGWTVDESHAVIEGVEIDIVATDPTGRQWWIECKGSHRGAVPGARRGDTVKKAVAVAWYLHSVPDRRPYMLVVSHMPKPGSVGDRMLTKARSAGLFDHIQSLSFTAEMDDLPEGEDS
jgi:hypothetical protein